MSSSPYDQIEHLVSELASLLTAMPSSPTQPVASFSKVTSSQKGLPGMIDHTVLKPEATPADVHKICEEARAHKFASVCVHSSYVPYVKEWLLGSGIKTCAVVGFPLGAMATAAKAAEAREAVLLGADEIDMVIHLGHLKAREYAAVLEDIRQVVHAASPSLVKVILETGALTREEKIIGAVLSKLAGAHFVKTSTGFGKGSATTEDVMLLRQIVGPDMGVKASGGIRSYEDAQAMIEAGASRLGTSASVAIVSATPVEKGKQDASTY